MDWFIGFVVLAILASIWQFIKYLLIFHKKAFRGSGKKGLVEELLKERRGDRQREDAS